MSDHIELTAEERAFDVAQAIHSTEMEGQIVTSEAREVLDAYARGDIDGEEMMRRLRRVSEALKR